MDDMKCPLFSSIRKIKDPLGFHRVKVYNSPDILKYMLYLRIKAQAKKQDSLYLVAGLEGCLTGDTIIRTNRNSLGRKFTIKYMYNQFNSNPDKLKNFKQWNLSIPTKVRSNLGDRIGLHSISNVIYSGKKPVFLVCLEDGKSIKATADHKIMTDNGFVEVKDLLNCNVMVDTPNAISLNKNKHKFHDIQIGGLLYHKYGCTKRIEIHRLIYEANLNNLSFTDYVSVLSNNKDLSDNFSFINPELYVIHHSDFNHYNNNISNLILLTKKEHMNIHSLYWSKHFNQGNPTFSKVKSISYIGIEDTYDIVCNDPYHNFSANDIIVHNCGKSMFTLLAYASYCELKGLEPDIANVTRNVDELMSRYHFLQRNGFVTLDEAQEMASDRWNEKKSKEIKEKFTVMRERAFVSMICYPNPLKVSVYFREDRIRGVFFLHHPGCVYFYANSNESPHFAEILDTWDKYNKTKSLKKFTRYAPDFIMHFPEYKGVIRDAYDKRKDENISSVLNRNVVSITEKFIVPDNYISVKDAAKILNRNAGRIKVMMAEGKLECSFVGIDRYVTKENLDKFIELEQKKRFIGGNDANIYKKKKIIPLVYSKMIILSTKLIN